MISLRPYQVELLNATRKAYADGFRKPCIVAPCGAGKSHIVAEMARSATAKGNRVLFIVHRQELCDQINELFARVGVNMRLCTVGMVQTITRRLDTMKAPALIITDENHHSPARSYKRIYEHFPDAMCVGVTATPTRLNGGGLGDVNDILITGVDARWLIDNQFLAPYDYYAPTLADMTGVQIRAGEFDPAEVAKRLSKPSIYGDAVQYYKRLADGQKAICYCASIELSKRMAAEFPDAAHIDGTTPRAERDEIIQRFRDGEIRILCNVDLISEGFDIPDCSCAILLRPTQSMTLYIQQSMRCMRYQPDKTAIIIDHVGNYMRHGLPDTAREWDLNPAPKRSKAKSEIHIKQCPKCFFVHQPGPECPRCGFLYPSKPRTIKEVRQATLERITANYVAPIQCTTMAQLQVFAKRRGFKPGWAYYEAKRRGLV